LQIKHAREVQKDHQEVLPKDTTDRELLKKAGRYHLLLCMCTPQYHLHSDKHAAKLSSSLNSYTVLA